MLVGYCKFDPNCKTQQEIGELVDEFGRICLPIRRFACGVRLFKLRAGNGIKIRVILVPEIESSFQWKIDNATNTELKYRVRPVHL